MALMKAVKPSYQNTREKNADPFTVKGIQWKYMPIHTNTEVINMNLHSEKSLACLRHYSQHSIERKYSRAYTCLGNM